MKNPFKLFKNWILRFFRRKEFKKRQEVYDDAIEKLAPLVDKKKNDQKKLKEEIDKYMLERLGYDSDSKFIPKSRYNNADLRNKIHIKFKFRMDKLDMTLTEDLRLVCI